MAFGNTLRAGTKLPKNYEARSPEFCDAKAAAYVKRSLKALNSRQRTYALEQAQSWRLAAWTLRKEGK